MCKVCATILSGDNELKQRIYNSAFFTPNNGGETLREIHQAYGGSPNGKGGVFAYIALTKHCAKHQTLDDKDRIRRSQSIVKELKQEQAIALQEIVKPEDVHNEVLSQGLEALKAGELKLTARDVLKAATDKANIDLKKKDQEFKLAEMVYHFASGEASNASAYDRRIIEGEAPTAYDAADITAGNLTTESDWPRHLYNQTLRYPTP